MPKPRLLGLVTMDRPHAYKPQNAADRSSTYELPKYHEMMTKRFYLPLLIVHAMIGLAVSASSTCLGADYYFSVTGDDISGVGSIASPWQTTTKFNSIDFDPGDRAFFHTGETFNGNLYLDANDSGTNDAGQLIAPIRIGSYNSVGGNDRAIVRSPSNREAFFAYNNGGIELHDLEFVNGGSVTSNPKSGVIFQVDQNQGAGLSKYEHVRVDNVVSHGFAANGIEVYAHGSVGYQDVAIVESEFYGNLNAGVSVGANLWTQLIHRDVHVDRVVARDNPGFSGCSPHCGQGIVLGQVDSAVIENSIAHTNGAAFGKGNVGIWAWQSNEVTIQRNLAYDNLSPAGPDGGGFDIDGGVTNSVVQYNVARNNAGAGYLLAEFDYAEPMSQNVFRYNLSVNDGKDAYGPISIWGADSDDVATSAVFHNNTVILDASVAPNARGAVHFINENHAEIDFINNVFVALNGAELVTGNTTTEKSAFVNKPTGPMAALFGSEERPTRASPIGRPRRDKRCSTAILSVSKPILNLSMTQAFNSMRVHL